MTNSLAWDFYTTDGDIVISDVVFIKKILTAEEKAFEILANEDSYHAQAHGAPDDMTVEDGVITISVTTSNDTGRGFAIKPATIVALHELGFDSISFTITAPSPYINIYHDCGTYTALSGGTLEGGEYSYASGETVTINIKALAEADGWTTSGYGVYFVLTNSLAWDFYTTDGDIVISNVVFA